MEEERSPQPDAAECWEEIFGVLVRLRAQGERPLFYHNPLLQHKIDNLVTSPF